MDLPATLADCTDVLASSHSHWVRDADVRHISEATTDAVTELTDHVEPDELLDIVRASMEIGYAIALRDHRGGDLDTEYCHYNAENA